MDNELQVETANDVKWLKSTTEAYTLSNTADHKLILERLEVINVNIGANKGDIAVCKKDLSRLWWVVGIITLGLIGVLVDLITRGLIS